MSGIPDERFRNVKAETSLRRQNGPSRVQASSEDGVMSYGDLRRAVGKTVVAHKNIMVGKARKSWTLRFILIQCLLIVITYLIIIYWKPDNIAGRIGIASILTFVWGVLSTVIIYTNNSNSNRVASL